MEGRRGRRHVHVSLCLLLCAGAFTQVIHHCVAQTEVTGVVVDRDGKPIPGVRFSICGFSTPSGDIKLYSGERSFGFTDKEGRFAIPHPGSDRSDELLDLQFDEDGGHFVVTNWLAARVPLSAHAPEFVDRVKPADSPLSVVMTEGKVLKGRIVERVNGQLAPVANAEIELQTPQAGDWYQNRQRTDRNGEFQFRISEPPKPRPWMLYYAGKRLTIDYEEVTPATVMVIEVSIKVTSNPEPGTASKTAVGPNREQSGTLDFINAEVPQVLAVYRELTGTEVDIPQNARVLRARITLQPRTRLSRLETVKLIETALREQAGVVLTHLDGKRVTVSYDDPVRSQAGQR
jgi:hypothetical protein